MFTAETNSVQKPERVCSASQTSKLPLQKYVHKFRVASIDNLLYECAREMLQFPLF